MISTSMEKIEEGGGHGEDGGTSRSVDSARTQVKSNSWISHPIFMYIIGDLAVLNEWLVDKPLVLQLPNWILRCFGAPIFLNNPISGTFILIGMFISNPWTAINALIGCIVAIIFCLLIKVPRGDIVSGGATFHGMLVGLVLPTVMTSGDWYPWIIFPVIVMAAVSVYIASGLGSLMGRLNLPAFNFPFVLTTFLFIGAVQYDGMSPYFPINPVEAPNGTTSMDDLDWVKFFHPLLLSGAQIYGSTSLVTGALILTGMVIGSPIVALHALASGIISIFTALALSAPFEEIYLGVWSYNALLTCCSLGGFFWVLTWQSHLLALISACVATVAHGAIAKLLLPTGLPVIAFPFVLTASLFLSVNTESKLLKRVPLDQLTTPEKHRHFFNPSRVDHEHASSAWR